MSTPVAAGRRDLDREWWGRTLAVLVRPREVFAALREDESPEALGARQEPLLAVIWLAGIAGVLLSSAAAHFLDNYEVDKPVLAVYAFIAGGIYGVVGYWIAGAAVYVGLKGAESPNLQYRRARHVLGFAVVPLVVSLLVWPVRLAVYGTDLFRSGGSDTGAGDVVFRVVLLAFVAWSLCLLVVGIRTTEQWSWRRSLAAVALAAAVLGLFGAIPFVL